jgi:hypothetical protein
MDKYQNIILLYQIKYDENWILMKELLMIAEIYV